jgi:hypothetical protein
MVDPVGSFDKSALAEFRGLWMLRVLQPLRLALGELQKEPTTAPSGLIPQAIYAAAVLGSGTGRRRAHGTRRTFGRFARRGDSNRFSPTFLWRQLDRHLRGTLS